MTKINKSTNYKCPDNGVTTLGRHCVKVSLLSFISITDMDFNPWEVSNLECFLFYCCPECDYKCQDVTGFESHANTHPQSVTCIARMKEVVGMVTGEKGHHFCKLCGKYFTSSQRWSQHMKNSHGDAKPYKCDICDAGFTQPTDVVRHSDRVHKNERPFKCDICDQGFVRKYELSQHLKLSHPSLKENKENIIDVTFVCQIERSSNQFSSSTA